tara:strand:+ start:260 stop:1099 length:840 start_codon:yes stop_codon:yes gene_type:complete
MKFRAQVATTNVDRKQSRFAPECLQNIKPGTSVTLFHEFNYERIIGHGEIEGFDGQRLWAVGDMMEPYRAELAKAPAYLVIGGTVEAQSRDGFGVVTYRQVGGVVLGLTRRPADVTLAPLDVLPDPPSAVDDGEDGPGFELPGALPPDLLKGGPGEAIPGKRKKRKKSPDKAPARAFGFGGGLVTAGAAAGVNLAHIATHIGWSATNLARAMAGEIPPPSDKEIREAAKLTLCDDDTTGEMLAEVRRARASYEQAHTSRSERGDPGDGEPDRASGSEGP